MKNLIYAVFTVLLLASCGNPDAKSEDSAESPELTIQEENALADSLSMGLTQDKEEIQQATEENLEEIDSLLENF